MPTDSLSLDGSWTLHGGPGGQVPSHPDGLATAGLSALAATVPGNVELALHAAGFGPDPLVAPGTWDYVRFEQWAWWYERTFTCPPGLAAAWRTELVLDGLDCLGSVWLNGVHLGDTANALVGHRLDATRALRPGANRLCIRVSSGMREARAGDLGPVNTYANSMEMLRLRKPAHQFGWDIMPRLVSAGLWRGVRLEALPAQAVTEAYWTTMRADPEAGTATVSVAWSLRLPEEGWERWKVRLAIDGLHRVELGVISVRGHRNLDLTGVGQQLWWPRGWGEARLHTARIELLDAEGRTVDVHETRLGIRSIAVRRSEALAADGSGEFALVVNGERFYARGTNWVPLDALHSRDRSHLDAALALLAGCNCNTVRMWGGSVYEHDDFYAWCDANGMLVWQDFAFACAQYPQDDAFAAVVSAEAAAVVRRLRNHPCLALWCGSNETDENWFWRWPGRRLDPNQDRITRRVLAQAVADHDPVRDYLPSSPYFSPAVFAGGGMPEAHLWGPRDDFKGPFYRGAQARFVSEIGYHGCPERASLERMVAPGTPLWPVVGNAALMPLSVKPLPGDESCDYRNGLMARQARQLIGRECRDLDEFVLASQLSQAEAMKSFVETWRGRKGSTWGMLWWNLRDGWPIISDAVVDWFNRPKLAYHAIAASQQDVLALVNEAEGWEHQVKLVNDRRTPVAAELVIDDLDGAELWRGRVAVPANGLVTACRLPQQLDGCACWRLRWTLGDGSTGTNHYVAGPRPWPLERLTAWYRTLGLQQTP